MNLLAVILAAVSSMAVGAFWYAKSVFGADWQTLTRLTDKQIAPKASKALPVAFVTSLVMAYVLAHVAFISNYFFRHSFLQDSVTIAVWMWLGFQGLRVIMHDTFEQRRKKLTLINIGNDFVTIVVMGLIIGWIGI
ncbi:MAG: DUF1761 domain-containing protein [Patescibacteria group bacterium]